MPLIPDEFERMQKLLVWVAWAASTAAVEQAEKALRACGWDDEDLGETAAHAVNDALRDFDLDCMSENVDDAHVQRMWNRVKESMLGRG